VIAGSPEDKAFQQIDAESNTDKKIALLQDFEKQFPQSKTLREVYLELMKIYQEKNDSAKVMEYGEKIIKVDADNLSALLTLSRAYALERKNLDRAVQYAQKAVDIATRMKSQPPPAGYSDEQVEAVHRRQRGACTELFELREELEALTVEIWKTELYRALLGASFRWSSTAATVRTSPINYCRQTAAQSVPDLILLLSLSSASYSNRSVRPV